VIGQGRADQGALLSVLAIVAIVTKIVTIKMMFLFTAAFDVDFDG
jgi:hypothetical protein